MPDSCRVASYEREVVLRLMNLLKPIDVYNYCFFSDFSCMFNFCICNSVIAVNCAAYSPQRAWQRHPRVSVNWSLCMYFHAAEGEERNALRTIVIIPILHNYFNTLLFSSLIRLIVNRIFDLTLE